MLFNKIGTAAFAAVLALSGFLLGVPATLAQAQEWPSHPVKMVVPFGPGGSNDLITRALADYLSRKFGQPFLVENRAGAGGYVGTKHVMDSRPDGYTLLVTSSGITAMGWVQHVEFNPAVDVAPIAMIAKSPTGVVVPGSLPVTTIQELIDYAKANPDTTFYGATGQGTTPHLHAELFNLLTGTTMKPVMYKSSGEAQTDLAAGRIQMMFVTVAGTLGQLQAGTMRLLAYTNDAATPDSPPAPTVAEAGVEGFDTGVWWGFFGSPGLDPEIQHKLNEATIEATVDPAFAKVLLESGATATTLSVEEFAEEIDRQTIELEEIITTTNIVFE